MKAGAATARTGSEEPGGTNVEHPEPSAFLVRDEPRSGEEKSERRRVSGPAAFRPMVRARSGEVAETRRLRYERR
tara:strand:- start:22682 stop:22906 length:225 start_codon:yes stop_codon:yes gene_type:complete